MEVNIRITKDKLESGIIASSSLIGLVWKEGITNKDDILIEMPFDFNQPTTTTVLGYTIISLMQDVIWLTQNGYTVRVRYAKPRE
jgi:hypothetical protein